MIHLPPKPELKTVILITTLQHLLKRIKANNRLYKEDVVLDRITEQTQFYTDNTRQKYRPIYDAKDKYLDIYTTNILNYEYIIDFDYLFFCLCELEISMKSIIKEDDLIEFYVPLKECYDFTASEIAVIERTTNALAKDIIKDIDEYIDNKHKGNKL